MDTPRKALLSIARGEGNWTAHLPMYLGHRCHEFRGGGAAMTHSQTGIEKFSASFPTLFFSKYTFKNFFTTLRYLP